MPIGYIDQPNTAMLVPALLIAIEPGIDLGGDSRHCFLESCDPAHSGMIVLTGSLFQTQFPT
jgi:hypothetical protein